MSAQLRYYVADRLASIASDLRLNPAGWTQGAFARDMVGLQVGPKDERAACWCTDGHLRRLIEDDHQRHLARELVAEAAGLTFPVDVPDPALLAWNDDQARTVADVQRAFAGAAAVAAAIREEHRSRNATSHRRHYDAKRAA